MSHCAGLALRWSDGERLVHPRRRAAVVSPRRVRVRRSAWSVSYAHCSPRDHPWTLRVRWGKPPFPGPLMAAAQMVWIKARLVALIRVLTKWMWFRGRFRVPSACPCPRRPGHGLELRDLMSRARRVDVGINMDMHAPRGAPAPHGCWGIGMHALRSKWQSSWQETLPAQGSLPGLPMCSWQVSDKFRAVSQSSKLSLMPLPHVQ